MALGEALARCPRLMLIPPDPVGVADLWERMLVRLESVGAAIEPERPGLGCFEARGLLRLHGGIEGVLTAVRRALRAPARYGVAPSRFAAVVAASQARVRRPVIVGRTTNLLHRRLASDDRAAVRAYLAPKPVKLLRARPELAELPETLERLGIRTLGELASLPPATLADRFGKVGLYAHQLATGTDVVLQPRTVSERVRESLELPEAATGPALEQALELLIDRLLARPERRGRTVRSVVLSAVLVEHGGGWRELVAFREALADPVRMRLALAPRLHSIPAPADELRVAVERFGPPAGDQRPLVEDPTAARMARLLEAIRQARAAAGPEAALRVLEVDPDSRFPERRAVLAPFEG
jgi:protein ImuB